MPMNSGFTLFKMALFEYSLYLFVFDIFMATKLNKITKVQFQIQIRAGLKVILFKEKAAREGRIVLLIEIYTHLILCKNKFTIN